MGKVHIHVLYFGRSALVDKPPGPHPVITGTYLSEVLEMTKNRELRSSLAERGQKSVDVLIVGAGISGIGLASHLTRRLPEKSFQIVEARENIGGT